MRALALAYEGHDSVGYPVRLFGTEAKLGCTCISVGSEIGADPSAPNVASSVGRALDSVLRFFEFATRPPATATELGEAFAAAEAKAAGINGFMLRAEAGKARNAGMDAAMPNSIRSRRLGGLFGRLFSSSPALRSSSTKKSGVQQHIVSSSLTVSDFDLLRVVGKGAFGKVMLVRKKQDQVRKHSNKDSSVFIAPNLVSNGAYFAAFVGCITCLCHESPQEVCNRCKGTNRAYTF